MPETSKVAVDGHVTVARLAAAADEAGIDDARTRVAAAAHGDAAPRVPAAFAGNGVAVTATSPSRLRHADRSAQRAGMKFV
jgi:hypothetical protein